jgi:hypothetical protein
MSNIDVKIELSGLLPFEKYDYLFEGMGGNWPCIVTPYSGTIRPYAGDITIEGKVHFCSSKTSCSSNSVGFLPHNTGLCDPSPNLFTTLRVSLKPENFAHKLYTNSIIVSCDDCFAQPNITIPANVSLNQAQGNEYTLISNVAGLQPNEIYTYSFESIDANWPVKVSPVSGMIKVPKDRTTIISNVMFCANTGLCQSGPDIMEYTVDDSCLLGKNLYSTIQLSILPSGSCNKEQVISNPMSIYCKNCLPTVSSKILPVNKKIVSLSENVSGLLLEPVISGLDINKKYSYTFKSVDANWPVFINPVSGILQSSSATSSISSQLFFCSNSGVCSSGTRGVLEYRPELLSSNHINYDPFVNLELEIKSLTCGTVYTSDTLMIYCNECLPPKSDPRIITSRIT